MKKKQFTKRPMELTSVRLPQRDYELWKLASAREEISQSEFLRIALRERAVQILREETQRLEHALRKTHVGGLPRQ